MSSPDSALPGVLRPVAPVLTVVPRPASGYARARAALHELPVAAVAAAGLAAVQSVAFVAGRVLAVNLNFDIFVDTGDLARGFGIVSFLSIVAIVAAMLLGHRGLAAIPSQRQLSRHIATIVLGVAYLHLILWFTRVISASVAAASLQSSALFMPSVFWWG
ncbi:MAG TPA: hypothetical protein VNR36_12245 [Pseudolysinimonas sp.]|nr:hypothetical protein [Pseudolysinimonas sp.]